MGVYLTNSLEEPEATKRDLFSQWLTTESLEANEVKKEMPIMVVIGNPPYAVSSTNKGEWIESLMKDYKKDLNERNIQPLSDDYIKFIRYAQWFIEKNGEGVIAYISNNSFIDGLIHRQMRKSLLETFDKIYILDLHGNAKKKEVAPDGSKDENVFDIMQGVSINIFVKNKNSKSKLGEVYHSELWGKREKKYEELGSEIKDLKWEKLNYREPEYFFVKKDFRLSEEYERFVPIKNLFVKHSIGIVSGSDSILISRDKEALVEKFSKIKEKIMKIAYRPFDFPYVPFDNKVLQRARFQFMQNLLGNNFSLNAGIYAKNLFPQVLITNTIVGKHFVTDQTYSFPLYLYSDLQIDSSTRKPNLDRKIVDEIATKLKLQFVFDHEHKDSGKKGTFNPLDILDYIYAVPYSPTYRERYKEFLKIDFPRIPFTSDQKLFWKLVEKGRELREYHLMEHKDSSNLITKFAISGENDVAQAPKFEDNKVWINETQYFDSVPEIAWGFYTGGYQPAQKWLKDRRGRKLSFDEVLHYQKIIVALVNTDRVMKEIDKLIPKWPIK